MQAVVHLCHIVSVRLDLVVLFTQWSSAREVVRMCIEYVLANSLS